jgi:hypothetical protein
MQRDQDLQYFEMRAAKERERAENAQDTIARRLHFELSRRYELAAESMREAAHSVTPADS